MLANKAIFIQFQNAWKAHIFSIFDLGNSIEKLPQILKTVQNFTVIKVFCLLILHSNQWNVMFL